MKIDGSYFLLGAYFFLLMAGIMVPSDGSHGLFSIKSLAFLGALFAFAMHLVFNPGLSRGVQYLIIFTFSAFLFLFGALAAGLASPSSAIDQLKLFIITLFVPLITLYLIDRRLLDKNTFFRFVIFASFSFSVIKLSLVVLNMLHVINLLKVMEKLGIRFMSMAIYGGIGRVQTSVDILTPFILYFALMHEKLNIPLSKWFMRFFIPISWIAIFLSFSRFLILSGLIAHAAYWITLDRKRLVLALSRFAFIVILGGFAVGPEKIYTVIERRFFSEAVGKSDNTRYIQMESLWKGFMENPFFGKGLGGYTEDSIRDYAVKHSYEVQWAAFLMQFGLFGLVILLSPLLLIYKNILTPPVGMKELSLFLMFSLWLFSGFTNPFLISLTSGIVYALFGVAPFNLRSKPSIV